MATLASALAAHRQGRIAEAEALYRAVLATTPDDVTALHMLGVTLHQQGRSDAAVEPIRRALAFAPNDAAAHSNLALALRELGRLDEALASIDRALSLAPGTAQAWNNRGNILRALRRPSEALGSYDEALARKPDHALAHRNRGDVLLELGRARDALSAFEQALAIDANNAELWHLRGIALGDLGDHAPAVFSFERALQIAPAFAQARFNRGSALLDLRRYADAAEAFRELADVEPGYPYVRGQLLHARMLACAWDGLDALAGAMLRDIRMGRRAAEPFGLQAIATSPTDLAVCARVFAQDRFPATVPVWHGERYGHRRTRIGYVSGEFRQQATSLLIAELIERHDRQRFELHAFDNGSSDGSALRERLERAFEHFVDIASLSDNEAAAAVRSREIDILVDLNGFFGRHRQGLFARRAAPVQVNYLGFPGTLGAEYHDYLIADAHVIPHGDDVHYVERIVRLPDCYQPNDTTRALASSAPTRAQAGLPEQGFVFCCFNNNYKITPTVFDAWMRVLRDVEGSVLWLLEDNPDAAANLRREAEARSVDAGRIVFAPRVAPEQHLARHRLADLFLDTLPYNAHTTASDALWTGLPLVTVYGTTFPGRVAASLLRAAGLPELVTATLDEYATLAIALATDRARLQRLREKLALNRDRCALFDSDRFRRHLEAAYETMWRRHEQGEAPAAFDVPPGAATA